MFKATRPDAQLGFGIALGDFQRGATPAEYLDRLALHNQLFADDVSLESVVQLPHGKISIVTSQPAIKMHREATAAEIAELMASQHFQNFGAGAHYDPDRGLLVYDMFPRNVLVDADEIPHVIDPVIQRVTSDFADFIRENPHLIENAS